MEVVVEKVFRGRKFDKPVVLNAATYKNDYRLLSKKEEAEYCKVEPEQKVTLLSPEMELPPLLKEFIRKETGVEEPRMKVKYRTNIYKTTRLAEKGETPDIQFTMGVGKPHPKGLALYEGVQL